MDGFSDRYCPAHRWDFSALHLEEEKHMAKGALTVQAAHKLQDQFNAQGFDILYDHGKAGIDPPTKLGKIRSWFGDSYQAETILADLDIAVVSKHKERVYALIEIEGTANKPKVIFGDVITALLGNGINFQGKRDLRIGKWTTLIVMAHDANQNHLIRIPYLTKQSNFLRENLLTPNASIGQVIIDTFSDDVQLEDKLNKHINDAISKNVIRWG
jgi:hypothetical protein